MTEPVNSRWPRWVYEKGEEPDPRFTLANERTYLAWIRTALGLLAGGVALSLLEISVHSSVQKAIALVLLLTAAVTSLWAWWHWAKTERAIRTSTPLPSSGYAFVLAFVLLIIAILVAWTLL